MKSPEIEREERLRESIEPSDVVVLMSVSSVIIFLAVDSAKKSNKAAVLIWDQSLLEGFTVRAC